MQRYSLIFGLIGLLAGVGLFFVSLTSPKHAAAPALFADEVWALNIGTTEALPDPNLLSYTNTALGLNFLYPTSWGSVLVEKHDGGVYLSFSKTGAVNDPDRKIFMAAPFIKPEGREGYWGDLAWEAHPDARWIQGTDACSLVKEETSSMIAWAKTWLSGTTCTNMTVSDRSVAQIKGMWSDFRAEPALIGVYLIPVFRTTSDHLALDLFAASDERLIGEAGYTNPEMNMEKLVQSIEFLTPQE
jgi:hypothetical protein